MSRICSSASVGSDSLRQASRMSAWAPARSPLGEERAAEREASLGRQRPVSGERANGGEVGVLLPQHRFGPLAEHRDARPARIGGDEGLEAGEIGAVLVAAQDRPFDQLAGEGIGDPLLHFGGVFRLAATGIFDRLPHGREVRGGSGHGRRQGPDVRVAVSSRRERGQRRRLPPESCVLMAARRGAAAAAASVRALRRPPPSLSLMGRLLGRLVGRAWRPT